MLNIALSNDYPGQLTCIAVYASQCMLSNQYADAICQFFNPEDLLDLCETQRFHLHIPDTVLPMIDGAEGGEASRELGQEAQMRSYCAACGPGFVFQSFVMNLINDPKDKQQFFNFLAPAVNCLVEDAFPVKSYMEMRICGICEEKCWEHIRHRVIYFLAGAQSITARVFTGAFCQHVARMLQYGRFSKLHVSCVLNMEHHEDIKRNKNTLRNGCSVPIAADNTVQCGISI